MDNNNVTNKNKMNKLKINKTTNILKLNNKTYIPFQLHQLPKRFEEICPSDIIKLKGYIYIEKNNFKNPKNIIETLTHNKDLNYVQSR